MQIFWYIIAAIVGYFSGCSHMSYYISRSRRVDMKSGGSKNYGASNAVLLIGMKAGIIVFLHDMLKSVIPIIAIRLIFPTDLTLAALAGCGAVIGHIFPFYLKFDGGKGFATFIGVILAIYPEFGFIALLIAICMAIIADKLVFATFSFCVASTIYAFVVNDIAIGIMIACIAIVIILKHKNNIINLITRNGQEASIKESVFKKKK